MSALLSEGVGHGIRDMVILVAGDPPSYMRLFNKGNMSIFALDIYR